jgi:hypothetical protein
MMADHASGGRAQHTVMTRNVSRGTADHGTLDASLRVSRNHHLSPVVSVAINASLIQRRT